MKKTIILFFILWSSFLAIFCEEYDLKNFEIIQDETADINALLESDSRSGNEYVVYKVNRENPEDPISKVSPEETESVLQTIKNNYNSETRNTNELFGKKVHVKLTEIGPEIIDGEPQSRFIEIVIIVIVGYIVADANDDNKINHSPIFKAIEFFATVYNWVFGIEGVDKALFPIGSINNKHGLDSDHIKAMIISGSTKYDMCARIPVFNGRSVLCGDTPKLVWNRFFKGYNKFYFNVVFSINNPKDFEAEYINPNSKWFNVFFGYYEIDCPINEGWNRAFGYNVDGTINVTELAKLGKADWNYFSNYMYGTPKNYIESTDNIPSIEYEYFGRIKIGEKYWDKIALYNVKVISGYDNNLTINPSLNNNAPASLLWQIFYGQSPWGDYGRDFPSQKMDAMIYMCWDKNDYMDNIELETSAQAYRTFFFGGTERAGRDNGSFLNDQMDAAEARIILDYSDLGFDSEEVNDSIGQSTLIDKTKILPILNMILED